MKSIKDRDFMKWIHKHITVGENINLIITELNHLIIESSFTSNVIKKIKKIHKISVWFNFIKNCSIFKETAQF